jgi:hypothetical protein
VGIFDSRARVCYPESVHTHFAQPLHDAKGVLMDLEAILGLLLVGAAIIVPVVIGLIVVAVILVSAFLLGRYVLRRSQRTEEIRETAQEWPSTSGVVLESRVEAYTADVMRARPKVVYAYTVEGQRYQGKQIRAGVKIAHPLLRQQAIEVIGRYPEGSMVTVYYDPSNPAESALER